MTVYSGGLGLAGGIADVGSLADALAGIHRGVADDSILDRYAELRAGVYRDVIDPMSTANFRRLWERDPETTAAEDEFFALVREMAEDEGLARRVREVRVPPLFKRERRGFSGFVVSDEVSRAPCR